MNAILNQIAAFASRYEKPLSWFAIGWFALTCATYAGFIDLPEIPYITDRNSWMISAPYNAVWWGFLRPALLKRKQALEETDPARQVSHDDA